MNYKDLYFLSINEYLIDTEHVMALEEYNQLGFRQRTVLALTARKPASVCIIQPT